VGKTKKKGSSVWERIAAEYEGGTILREKKLNPTRCHHVSRKEAETEQRTSVCKVWCEN